MRSVLLIRCLPKMRHRRRLPPVHRLPPGGDPWHEQRCEFGCNLPPASTEKMFVRPPSFPLRTRFSMIFFHHSQLSDLTIRLYRTTSLKSISLKQWLYHQMFKLSSDQFNSRDANHVISHSSFWLVNRLTADEYRCYDHKYINYTDISCSSSVKSIMDNRWQWLSFNAKLARD